MKKFRRLATMFLMFLFVSIELNAGCEDSFAPSNEETLSITETSSDSQAEEIRVVRFEILDLKELDSDSIGKDLEFIVIWLDEYLND